MLEAMNDDEIRAVVDMATSVPKVQAITIEEADGKKRVLLRYYDKHGPYVNISENLKLANTKYRNWEYDEATKLQIETIKAPILDSLKTKQSQEELDLQKELEAKFDELFGPIDED